MGCKARGGMSRGAKARNVCFLKFLCGVVCMVGVRCFGHRDAVPHCKRHFDTFSDGNLERKTYLFDVAIRPRLPLEKELSV